MKFKYLCAIAITLTLMLIASPTLADSSVDEVSAGLVCQCGCTMIVNVCTCETADQMRQIISTKLSAGQTPSQIWDYFVSQYGEKVLAAPTKEGFNLTAWVTPFIAIAAGFGFLYLILKEWVFKKPTKEEPGQVIDQQLVDVYSQRFERELSKFDEGGLR